MRLLPIRRVVGALHSGSNRRQLPLRVIPPRRRGLVAALLWRGGLGLSRRGAHVATPPERGRLRDRRISQPAHPGHDPACGCSAGTAVRPFRRARDSPTDGLSDGHKFHPLTVFTRSVAGFVRRRRLAPGGTADAKIVLLSSVFALCRVGSARSRGRSARLCEQKSHRKLRACTAIIRRW